MAWKILSDSLLRYSGASNYPGADIPVNYFIGASFYQKFHCTFPSPLTFTKVSSP
jgi:hypothetical protein